MSCFRLQVIPTQDVHLQAPDLGLGGHGELSHFARQVQTRQLQGGMHL